MYLWSVKDSEGLDDQTVEIEKNSTDEKPIINNLWQMSDSVSLKI